jgi:hypothetical protein
MASLVFSDDDTGRPKTFIADADSVIAVTQQWATHGRNIVNVNIYLRSGQTITCDMSTKDFDEFMSKLDIGAPA